MAQSRAWLPAAGAAAVVALAMSPALATWQDDLRIQMEQDEECDMAFLSNVVVREVEGREVVIARVHCMDKRAFDVSRGHEDDLFRVKACQVEREC